jgi:hypothetical protein
MEICMNTKPDFATMHKLELRNYILEHREDEEALHAYLDRLNTENPVEQIYQPEDDVGEAIAEYMNRESLKEA